MLEILKQSNPTECILWPWPGKLIQQALTYVISLPKQFQVHFIFKPLLDIFHSQITASASVHTVHWAKKP